jgi:hypothetical protein
MKLSLLTILFAAGLAMSATIDIGSSDVPSNNPWCGS